MHISYLENCCGGEPVRELSDKVIRDFDLFMASNVYDKLWESLIKAGILRSEDRGKIEFAFLRFGNFIKRQMLLYSLNAGNNYGLNG